MRGIETAFWGVLGKDPELRTSKTGNQFATMNITVAVGKDDSGKEAGEVRHGLNVTAWKVERLAAIGKNRQFREKGHEIAPSTFKSDARCDAEAAFKPGKQDMREKHDFDDAIPF